VEERGITMKTAYIFIEDKMPDDKGRQHFWIQWLSDTIGKHCNETGLRGTLTFGDLKEHIKLWEDRGYIIEFTNNLIK